MGSGSGRTRRSVRHANAAHHYETPDEEDELLDEALSSARVAAHRLNYTTTRPQVQKATTEPPFVSAYLTPSPSKDRNGVSFGSHDMTPSKPVNIPRLPEKNMNPMWPTPPYDENDWAAAAAASIFATQAALR